MHKLSDFIKIAAETYYEETGNIELNALWIAEFFQDCGVQDACPRQNLVNFAEMVQKELTKNDEQATKKTRFQLDKTSAQILRLCHRTVWNYLISHVFNLQFPVACHGEHYGLCF